MAGSLYSTADYAAAAAALFPRGRAWSTDPGSIQAQVREALAQSLQRVDAAAQSLLVDAFPASAVDLLAEWEESLDLPDPCAGAAPALAQRQGQVAARLAQYGGQSRLFFVVLAELLGFQIQITTFAPYRAGVSRCTDPVQDDRWAFAWRVDVQGPGPQPVLECEFRRLASAETLLSFVYHQALLTDGGAPILADGGQPILT